MRSVSLVTRVAQSAAIAAAVSALCAAVATSLLGGVLLREAEDRRLLEAGRDLVFLLSDGSSRRQLHAVVQHEHEETKHAGIRFTVWDRNGDYVAGDASLEHVAADACLTGKREPLRLCSVATGHGLIVTAAFAHTPHTSLFALATLGAFALSGLLTWFWCRPMVRSAMAPFSRLRARVAALDVEAGAKADLGSVEHVVKGRRVAGHHRAPAGAGGCGPAPVATLCCQCRARAEDAPDRGASAFQRREGAGARLQVQLPELAE